jgi:hypothetical protein
MIRLAKKRLVILDTNRSTTGTRRCVREEMEKQATSIGENVKIVHLGKGAVVSNWGTYGGLPAVFIERVLADPGTVGDLVKGETEPQIANDKVTDDGLILVLHNPEGAAIVIEDLQSAIAKF